jgi:hypothetical protein
MMAALPDGLCDVAPLGAALTSDGTRAPVWNTVADDALR